jgi:hypothetical protein
MPTLIKHFGAGTEMYLGLFAANTYLFESCAASSALALATPLFLVSQTVLVALLYGRVVMEVGIMENLPYKERGAEEKTVRSLEEATRDLSEDCRNYCHTIYYQYALGKLRAPWNIHHTVLGIATLALTISTFLTVESLPVVVLRLATAAALGIFLLAKSRHTAMLNKRQQALQHWVEAAPDNTERANRFSVQQEIIRYEAAEHHKRYALVDGNGPLAEAGASVADLSKSMSFKNLQLTRLPAQLGQLTTLEHLDLSGNKLTEIPYDIAELPNLKSLCVENNPLKTLPFKFRASRLRLSVTSTHQLSIPTTLFDKFIVDTKLWINFPEKHKRHITFLKDSPFINEEKQGTLILK